MKSKFSQEMTKKEKLDGLLGLIQNGEFTFDELQKESGIPTPTLYKYIKVLREEKKIYEDESKTLYIEEEKDHSTNIELLDMVLSKHLRTVKIKRILTTTKKEILAEENKEDTEKYIKTIFVEFNTRSYEQNVAELLFDEFFSEITLITTGIGGLIIYLRKNKKKSNLYNFLCDYLVNSKNE